MEVNGKDYSPCCRGNGNGGNGSSCKGKAKTALTTSSKPHSSTSSVCCKSDFPISSVSPVGKGSAETKSMTAIDSHPISIGNWKKSPNGICDQFEGYDDEHAGINSEVSEDGDGHDADDDPWTYSGKRLQALQFPLGGFGTYAYR